VFGRLVPHQARGLLTGSRLCLDIDLRDRGSAPLDGLLAYGLLALMSRDVTLARRPVALLTSCVSLARRALDSLESAIALMGGAIAFACDCVSLLRSASAEGGSRLPLPRGLAGKGACGIALGQHPVALSPRGVALGVGVVAFPDRLCALVARRIALVRDLRSEAGRCPLALCLGTEIGDAQADLSLDRVVSLGDGGVEGGERLAELAP
jgi:hypothetical protein